MNQFISCSLRVICSLLIILCISPSVSAQLAKDTRHHVVVLVDGGAHSSKKATIDLIKEDVKRLVTQQGFLKDSPNRQLLEQDDLISFMNFNIRKSKPDFDDFFHLNTGYIADHKYDRKKISTFGFRDYPYPGSSVFDSIATFIDRTEFFFFSSRYSLPYTARSLVFDYINKNSEEQINRCFIVSITNTKSKSAGTSTRKEELEAYTDRLSFPEELIHKLDDFDMNFLPKTLYKKASGTMELNVIEYYPKQTNFSISSIWEIPKNLEFQRTSSGYDLLFKISPKQKTTEYEVKKIKIAFYNKGVFAKDTILNASMDTSFVFDKTQKLQLHFPVESYNNIDSLSCHFWVKYNHPVFAKMVLHPYGTKNQGSNGLALGSPIYFKDHAKILGLISLPRSMFIFPLSESMNAIVWSLIILTLLLFLYHWIAKKNEWHVNKGNKVTLKDSATGKQVIKEKTQVVFNHKDMAKIAVLNLEVFKSTNVLLRLLNRIALLPEVIDYKHKSLSVAAIKKPNNLQINNNNLIIFEIDKQKHSGKAEFIQITEEKTIEVWFNKQALLDYRDFDTTKNSAELQIEITSQAHEGGVEEKINLIVEVELKKETLQSDDNSFKRSVRFEPIEKPVLFNDQETAKQTQVGTLVIKHNGQHFYADSLNINNLVVKNGEAVYIDKTKITEPKVLVLPDSSIVKDCKMIPGQVFLTEFELFQAIKKTATEQHKQNLVSQTPHIIHPQFDLNSDQENRLNIVLPGNSEIKIPVFANLTKLKNPTETETVVKYEFHFDFDGKHKLVDGSFVLARNTDHSEFYFGVDTDGSHRVSALKAPDGENNFDIQDLHLEWSPFASKEKETRLFSIMLGNKSRSKDQTQGATVNDLRLKFNYQGGKDDSINFDAGKKIDTLFSIKQDRDKPDSKSLITKKTFYNDRDSEWFDVWLTHSDILDIPSGIGFIECEVSYELTEESTNTNEQSTNQTKVIKHRIFFKLHKNLGPYWLALDFGTSAITAAFTDEVKEGEERNPKRFIDLQKSLKELCEVHNLGTYNQGNILEFQGADKYNRYGEILSSMVMFNDGGEIDAIDYSRNIIKLSPTKNLIQNSLVIPYLKSLIGIRELKIGDRYKNLTYQTGSLYRITEDSIKKYYKTTIPERYIVRLEQEFLVKEVDFLPKKEFISKLKGILGETIYDKYKCDLIDSWFPSINFINNHTDNSEKRFRAALEAIVKHPFPFKDDFVLKIKELIVKYKGEEYWNDDNNRLRLLADINRPDEPIDDNPTWWIGAFRRVEVKEGEIIDGRSKNYLEQPISIKDILQNTYESTLYNFIYPRIKEMYAEGKAVGENLKKYLNKIVLTIPNTFSPIHRDYIRELIESQFSEFEKKHIRFISESDAVAVHYANTLTDKLVGNQYVLVYDMGAGTLDVSYLKLSQSGSVKEVKIIGRLGKTTAGNYLDYVLAEYLRENTELIKEFMIGDMSELTYREFVRNEIKPQLDRKNEAQKTYANKLKREGKKLIELKDVTKTLDTAETVFKLYKNNQKRRDDIKLSLNSIVKELEQSIDKELDTLVETCSDKKEELIAFNSRLKKVLEIADISNLGELEALFKKVEAQKMWLEEYGKIKAIEEREKPVYLIGSNLQEYEEKIEMGEQLALLDKVYALYDVNDPVALWKIVDEQFAVKNSLRKQLAEAVRVSETDLDIELNKIEKEYGITNKVFRSIGLLLKKKNNIEILNEVQSYPVAIRKKDEEITELLNGKSFESLQKQKEEQDNRLRQLTAQQEELKNKLVKFNEQIEAGESELKDSLKGYSGENFAAQLSNIENQQIERLSELNITFDKSVGRRQLLQQLERDIEINREKQETIGDGSGEIKSEKNVLFYSKGDFFGKDTFIDTMHIKQSKAFKEYVEGNTTDLLENFYAIFKQRILNNCGEANSFPIDKVLVTGRASQVKSIQESLRLAVNKQRKGYWQNTNDAEFICNTDPKELKTVVVNGALYYVGNQQSQNHRVEISSYNLNAIYGLLYKREGKWNFIKLIYPGLASYSSQQGDVEGLQVHEYFNTAAIDSDYLTDCQFIQSYTDKPHEYKARGREEYFTVMSEFKGDILQGTRNPGVGLKLDAQGKVHLYTYPDLKYGIPNAKKLDEIETHLNVYDSGLEVLLEREFHCQDDFLTEAKKLCGKNWKEEFQQPLLHFATVEARDQDWASEVEVEKVIENPSFKKSMWPFIK